MCTLNEVRSSDPVKLFQNVNVFQIDVNKERAAENDKGQSFVSLSRECIIWTHLIVERCAAKYKLELHSVEVPTCTLYTSRAYLCRSRAHHEVHFGC